MAALASAGPARDVLTWRERSAIEHALREQLPSYGDTRPSRVHVARMTLQDYGLYVLGDTENALPELPRFVVSMRGRFTIYGRKEARIDGEGLFILVDPSSLDPYASRVVDEAVDLRRFTAVEPLDLSDSASE